VVIQEVRNTMNFCWARGVAGFGLGMLLLLSDAHAAGVGGAGSTAAGSATAVPATQDVLSQVLQGEFAFQNDDNVLAATKYLEAAQKLSDPGLAKRATEIALLAHEDGLATRSIARWRQLDPGSDDLASSEALLALREGDRLTARRKLLAILATGGEGWKRAIRTLASATDVPTAALVANDLFEQGHWPSSIDAWLAFGELSRRLGDPALTQRIVGSVVSRFPNEPRTWLLESARLQERGDKVAARKALDHALSFGTEDANVRTLAAADYARLGDMKTGAAVLAKGPQDTKSFIARAAYLAQSDDNPALAALYTEVKSQSGTPDAERQLLLGQLAEYLKRNDEALAWYRGVPRGISWPDAQNRIAIVLESGGNLEGALDVLRSQQRDTGTDGNSQPDSFRIEAELLAKHDRKTEALVAYGRGLAFFDGDQDLLYGRAMLLADMDRVKEAEADLRVIVTADPNNADALNALGYTLADRTDRYAEAQVLIEKALRLQPDSPAFLDSLGWVQHHLGRDAEALRNLRRAFSLQKDPEIAAHLGEVLWLGGDKDGARSVWKEGMAVDKDNRALNRVMQTYGP
jgi:tetratricopeptide (TPR) repeat protein